jgi:hypothetical protein
MLQDTPPTDRTDENQHNDDDHLVIAKVIAFIVCGLLLAAEIG